MFIFRLLGSPCIFHCPLSATFRMAGRPRGIMPLFSFVWTFCRYCSMPIFTTCGTSHLFELCETGLMHSEVVVGLLGLKEAGPLNKVVGGPF